MLIDDISLNRSLLCSSHECLLSTIGMFCDFKHFVSLVITQHSEICITKMITSGVSSQILSG